MRQYIDTLQDVNGNALVGAAVLVQNYVGGGAAQIFSDNGLTPISTSTVVTDSSGQFSFFAQDNDYNLVMSKNATVFKTQSPVTLFDGSPQLTYTDTGTANAYATASAQMEKALRPGLRTSFKAANANTGPSTYQYNGLAVKPLIQRGGIPISAAAVATGGIYQVEYDGTSWQLLGDPAAAPFYPISPFEIAAGVTPTQFNYPYGCPRRFGAKGDGVNFDTQAVQNAIISNPMYWGWQGDNYLVTTVVWPATSPTVTHFNGTTLTGGATTPVSSVMQIKSNFSEFYDVVLNGGSFAGVVPNSNYSCLCWWFNGVTSGAPVGASQFNSIFNITMQSAVRGMVYGGLAGQSSSTIVHSENKIFGFQTNGVSNPFFMNSSTGFLHTYGAIFFRDASSWTNPSLPSTARALEVSNGNGNLWMHGGEIIASNSTIGFGADLGTTATFEGVYLELSAPVRIFSDGVRFAQCYGQVLNQGVAMFAMTAAAAGVMEHTACTWFRPAGTGATDRSPLVDGSLSANFTVWFNGCSSYEWGFVQAGANVKLIQGCVAQYSNHRYSQTAGANVYILNNMPRVSIIPELTLDPLGYTTAGWILNVSFGGGSTLASTTNAGPTGYLASQLSLGATGLATAQNGDPTSLITVKATMQRVRPGEFYWISAWVNQATGGGGANIGANFYTLAGAQVGGFPTTAAADTTAIGTNAWVFVEGPIVVPATAAYMAICVTGSVATVMFTDVKVQRAN